MRTILLALSEMELALRAFEQAVDNVFEAWHENCASFSYLSGRKNDLDLHRDAKATFKCGPSPQRVVQNSQAALKFVSKSLEQHKMPHKWSTQHLNIRQLTPADDVHSESSQSQSDATDELQNRALFEPDGALHQVAVLGLTIRQARVSSTSTAAEGSAFLDAAQPTVRALLRLAEVVACLQCCPNSGRTASQSVHVTSQDLDCGSSTTVVHAVQLALADAAGVSNAEFSRAATLVMEVTASAIERKHEFQYASINNSCMFTCSADLLRLASAVALLQRVDTAPAAAPAAAPSSPMQVQCPAASAEAHTQTSALNSFAVCVLQGALSELSRGFEALVSGRAAFMAAPAQGTHPSMEKGTQSSELHVAVSLQARVLRGAFHFMCALRDDPPEVLKQLCSELRCSKDCSLCQGSETISSHSNQQRSAATIACGFAGSRWSVRRPAAELAGSYTGFLLPAMVAVFPPQLVTPHRMYDLVPESDVQSAMYLALGLASAGAGAGSPAQVPHGWPIPGVGVDTRIRGGISGLCMLVALRVSCRLSSYADDPTPAISWTPAPGSSEALKQDSSFLQAMDKSVLEAVLWFPSDKFGEIVSAATVSGQETPVERQPAASQSTAAAKINIPKRAFRSRRTINPTVVAAAANSGQDVQSGQWGRAPDSHHMGLFEALLHILTRLLEETSSCSTCRTKQEMIGQGVLLCAQCTRLCACVSVQAGSSPSSAPISFLAGLTSMPKRSPVDSF